MIKYFQTASHKPGSAPTGKVRAQRPQAEVLKLDTICADIAAKTTLTRADVHGTLCAIEEQVVKHVKDGQIVKFGLLGTFRPVVSSRSVLTTDAEAVKEMHKRPASFLRSVRILFQPAAELKDRVNLEARFEKVDPPKKKK